MSRSALVLRSLVITAASLVVVHGAVADDLEAQLRRQVEQLKDKAKGQQPRTARGQKESPKESLVDVKRSLSQSTSAKGSNGKSTSTDTEEWSVENNILGHYRLIGGVGFPAPEEVVVPPVPTFALPTQAQDPGVWKSEERPLVRPPRCEKNGTERVLRYPDLDDSKILYERIYLSEDMVPLDATEVYGSKVQLVPYGEPASEAVMLRMRSDQIPCVPFRRRITAAAIYEDWGINAFKKYEAKPSAPGVFHPWVEQKLFGGK